MDMKSCWGRFMYSCLLDSCKCLIEQNVTYAVQNHY